MTYPIKEILFGNAFTQYTIKNNVDGKRLPNLSKINIFVGANNSGKSRFLREIANTGTLSFIPNSVPPNATDFSTAINSCYSQFVQESKELIERSRMDSYNEFPAAFNHVKSIPENIEERSEPIRPMTDLLAKIANHTRIESYGGDQPDERFKAAFKALAKDTLKSMTTILDERSISIPYGFHKLYFPTLRGLRPFDATTDDYLERTSKDHFGTSLNMEIFTGHSLYKEFQKLLLGSLAERKSAEDFENFLGEYFFDSKPISLIPKLDSDVLDVKIGDEREFPIYDLGDGIQTIIILTFPLFRKRTEQVLACFEEPETYMHPGLQRIFLNVLHSHFPNHQYFLTTHSNHFLDVTLDMNDVSVYTFSKVFKEEASDERQANFNVENVSNENTSSLELLGVRNSSVFLSNCTIWVEGITDRRYLLHYLKCYMDKLHVEKGDKVFRRYYEDLHFSFVEYGGNNITHWSFLDAIDDPIDVSWLCGPLFLVSDMDDGEKPSRVKRHSQLQKKLGERYWRLECIEIENLLTPEVIKSIVAKYEGESQHICEFQYNDYKGRRLGEFIETTALKGKKRRTGSYQEDSGTLTGKLDFCDRAVAEIKSFSEVSPEAQALTKKLFEFIKEKNR